MKNKKWIFSIVIIFILIAYVFLSRPRDNIALMEKLISKHIKTKQSVTLYNATVIDNHRLVSYILKDAERYQEVGYAHFRINSKGKYELLNLIEPDKIIEKASDITIYEFSQLKSEFSQLITNDFSINTSLFIISNNPQLVKIERIMTNGEIQQKEVSTNPSISFFHDLDEYNKAEYKFYNKNGDIIK